MFRGLLTAGSAMLAITMTMPAMAHATEAEELPLPAFGQLLVDDAHDHVFVSGGRSSNTVVVLDDRGRVVKKIDGQFGATGLVLSEDGGTLFVAQATGDAISAISTTTLKETARYPTEPQTCPTHLARTGAIVWFGYGCENSWNGGIGKLDLAATPPVSLDEHGDELFQNAPLVRASGTTVMAAQLTTSLSSVQVYRSEAGVLTPGAGGEVTGSNLTDVALSPDGTLAHTAAGSRTGVQAFATDNLSSRGSYETGPYPNAVTASTDATHLAAGAYTTRAKAVHVFKLGQTTPVRSYELDGLVLANRGLAWSADNRYLYAVLQGANDSRPRITVFSRPLD
jgi:DNA-binding beta-propeller fold protein YncE